MIFARHNFPATSAIDSSRSGARFRKTASRGQALVEMGLIMPVVLFVMLIGIQYAIIGLALLGLGQANYQGARYAAVNSAATSDSVKSYMVSVASPIIGSSSGQYLSSSVNSLPCTFGGSVTVSVTFNASHLIVLPNPFFGIPFPTTLSNSETAFCES
jgi:Flp pilus assembly protein TadG